MGVSLFLTGLSNSFGYALFMRLITGMGNGGAVVPVMALTASWFAARKRGLAAGTLTIGSGMGVSIVGIGLPCFMAIFGSDAWRYAWYLLGMVVFALSFVCYAFLRDRPDEKGTSMYGGEETTRTYGDATFLKALKVVMREKEIWKLGIVYFMFGFSYIIYVTFYVAYLTSEAGLAPTKAGGIFAVLGLFSIFGGVVWGSISDVLGRRYGAMLAYLSLALSYILFSFSRDIAGFYVSSILFGFTLSAVPTIMAAAVGDSVGGKIASAALGFITLFFGIGQSTAPAIAGWMKRHYREPSRAPLSSLPLLRSLALQVPWMLRKKSHTRA
jgi:Sugar phosphate permease